MKQLNAKNHFDTNLVRIHSAHIEILSLFSHFVLCLVTADGSHLGTKNCKKKSKWLHAKFILTQVGKIPDSFQFHILRFLVTEAILTGLFLFNFESTPCKNHSDTNLVKIHIVVIEILSFSNRSISRFSGLSDETLNRGPVSGTLNPSSLTYSFSSNDR